MTLIIDLEIKDLINSSPNVPTRTPGQLLSLTSHFSFVSTIILHNRILCFKINIANFFAYRDQMRRLKLVVLV